VVRWYGGTVVRQDRDADGETSGGGSGPRCATRERPLRRLGSNGHKAGYKKTPAQFRERFRRLNQPTVVDRCNTGEAVLSSRISIRKPRCAPGSRIEAGLTLDVAILTFHRTTLPPYHPTTVPPYHRTTVPPYHRTTATAGTSPSDRRPGDRPSADDPCPPHARQAGT
jgi:hypothetical protein